MNNNKGNKSEKMISSVLTLDQKHSFSINKHGKNTISTIKLPTKNPVCPRSRYQFYIVTYYIKWVTTSLTDGICIRK